MNNDGYRRAGAIALMTLAMMVGSASADDYHYSNILIGERASGMGGAYTAISDDPSGLYYNPAGIVYAGGRRLSASVNAYHTVNTRYDDVLGGGDWSRESAALLPNFFGVIQPLGKGMLGFSYAVTDSIFENQDQRLRNTGNISEYVLNMNNEDNSYKIGPSYAMEVTDNLSIGATLYLHIRQSETILNQNIDLTSGTYVWQNGYLQTDETGWQPILGVMWSPTKRLALGASISQVLLLTSDVDSQAICVSNDVTACSDTTPVSSFSGSDEKRSYPLVARFGIAYFPSDRLLYSADFTYYSETDGQASEYSDNIFRTKLATWNASVGAEYYLSSNWALRGGLYTSNANSPVLESGRLNQPEHIDMLGMSLSLSRFTRNSSITAGVGLTSGSGEAQVVADTAQIQDASSSSMTFFLSTSYSY